MALVQDHLLVTVHELSWRQALRSRPHLPPPTDNAKADDTTTTTANNSTSTGNANIMMANVTWHTPGFLLQPGQRVTAERPWLTADGNSLLYRHPFSAERCIETISPFRALVKLNVFNESTNGAVTTVHGTVPGRTSPSLNSLDAAPLADPAPLLPPTPHQGWLISTKASMVGVVEIDFNTPASTLADSLGGARQQPAGAESGTLHGIPPVQEEARQPGPTVTSPVVVLIKLGVVPVAIDPSVESHSLASSPRGGENDFRQRVHWGDLSGAQHRLRVPWSALVQQPDSGPSTAKENVAESPFSHVNQGGCAGTAAGEEDPAVHWVYFEISFKAEGMGTVNECRYGLAGSVASAGSRYPGQGTQVTPSGSSRGSSQGERIDAS